VFEKIADNVYVMHGPLDEPNAKNRGFMNNPGLIVGKNGAIIIDVVLADSKDSNNGYFLKLKKNTDADALFVDYDQASFHNKIDYFDNSFNIVLH
jgi:hypothetical protein